MFKEMTVATRLGLVFAAMAAGLVGCVVFALGELGGLKADTDLIVQDRVPKVVLVHEIQNAANQTARSIRNVMLLSDPGERAKELAKVAETRQIVSEKLQKLATLVKTEKGKALLAQVIDARKAYAAAMDAVLAEINAGRHESALALLLGPLRSAQLHYMEALQAVSDFQVQLVEASAVAADHTYQRALSSMIVGALMLILVSGSVAFLVVRKIVAQLGGEPAYAAEIAQTIASGDLTREVRLRAGDHSSMLAAMQSMQRSLKETIASIHDEAARVSSTAEQLAASSDQIAVSSRQQAEATASMAATVEQMTVSIDEVSERSAEATRISTHSGELSEQGSTVIQGATDEMLKIETSVQASSAIISELERQSAEINGIVNVIKEVADQTNLLALNAAIEAARAGEQGRGFAVVADEVRKLAERTTQSTQEIALMIGKIQQGTRDAVASMEGAVDQVSQGVALANRAGNAIVEIRTEATHVVEVVNGISHSLGEQSNASSDIARNVETIAQMTEENSAAVQETASAAHHLEQMAISLQATVARFRVV